MKAPLDTKSYTLPDKAGHNNDMTPFDLLYSRYFKALYRKIYSMVRNEDIADELVKYSFLKLWQKRNEPEFFESVERYLYQIAAELVYNYFREAIK